MSLDWFMSTFRLRKHYRIAATSKITFESLRGIGCSWPEEPRAGRIAINLLWVLYSALMHSYTPPAVGIRPSKRDAIMRVM
jgi:hypothetical protein